jgi:DNA-binding NarL/FixJ family response regulator
MLLTLGVAAASSRPKAASIQEKTTVRTTVLIVDDNATFVGIVSRFLREQPGLDVVGTASNGAQAIKQAVALRPQVILLDLIMPGLAGLYALPQIRHQAPESAVIVLTLLEGEGYEEAAKDAGADGFVPKSSLYTDLVPAIREAALVAGARAQAPVQVPLTARVAEFGQGDEA